MWSECLLKGMETREPRKMWQERHITVGSEISLLDEQGCFLAPCTFSKMAATLRSGSKSCADRPGVAGRFGHSQVVPWPGLKLYCSRTGQSSLQPSLGQTTKGSPHKGTHKMHPGLHSRKYQAQHFPVYFHFLIKAQPFKKCISWRQMYFGPTHIPLELTTQSFQFYPQATVPLYHEG